MFRTFATQQQRSAVQSAHHLDLVNISKLISCNKTADIIDFMFCDVISTELSPRRRQVHFPAL
jgi:hypothetical protein